MFSTVAIKIVCVDILDGCSIGDAHDDYEVANILVVLCSYQVGDVEVAE
jgi:hypothetical protein